MKKKLMAVTLTFASISTAFMGNAFAQEAVELKITGDNVDDLAKIFAGAHVETGDKAKASESEISATKDISSLSPSSEESLKRNNISNKMPAIELISAEENVAVTQTTQEAPIKSSAKSVSNAKPTLETPKSSRINQVAKKNDDRPLENYQAFTVIETPIDYEARAAYWANKAPKSGEDYSFKSRVNGNDKSAFDALKQAYVTSHSADDLSLVDVNGLTTKGQQLYTLLLKSEEEGLWPPIYHVGRIQNLLDSGDIAHHQEEIAVLLEDGGIAYLRDIVLGRPEIKKQDVDWLLEGRSLNLPQAFLDLVASNDLLSTFDQYLPQYSEYKGLKKALRAFREKSGEEPAKIAEGATIKPGMAGERVVQMRDRLNYMGYDAGESTIYDAQMVKAVKAFQKTHLLEPDGAAGKKTIVEMNRSNDDRAKQIEINLERWRWMPATMGDHFVAVDIPGFRYEVVKNGEVEVSARTVVGREGRKTPVFMSPMSYIVFSPYWHVPRSMAVKDFLPRLKQNPYALTGSKIRIFRGGQEVDPGTVDWSQYSRNNFPFQLRQDPGDYNSLGRVKFMFPNEHAIYLHDTPSKGLFNRTSRDFSSGCVRIENPTELAEYFLGEAGWSEEKIKSAFRQSKESHVGLAKDKKIPVYTLYMTTRVNDDKISFRADIYNKDKALINALNKLEND